MRPRVFIQRGWLSVRAGRFHTSLRSPAHRPLFSERNRIGCRVLRLPRGWRIVVRRFPSRTHEVGAS